MDHKKHAKKSEKESITAFQLKISLKYIAPLIWRSTVVPADIELPDLHKIIQTAMGWMNGHLHQFIIHENYYGEVNEEFDNDWIDYKKIKLNSLVKKEGEKFEYDYDFGDGCDHIIEVEKIIENYTETKLPICLKGKRAAPPENCGGPPGYERLFEIVYNPLHAEYEETIDWLGGGGFDGEDIK